jgi:cytochrome c-type biogenesis protein CcmH/NrfG
MPPRIVRVVLRAGLLTGILALGPIPEFGQVQPTFVVRGHVGTSVPAESIRIVVEDPKAKGAVAAETTAKDDGSYELTNLTLRTYRIVAWIDGKKQPARNLEILCRPGTVMKKSFYYGKYEPTLTFYFPIEDPDIVDVEEIRGGFPASIMKEYAKARAEYANGNTRTALQRLEGLLTQAPDFYGLHTRLGMLYEQSGCYADAQTEFMTAVDLSPRSSQPLLNLARAEIQGAEGMSNETEMLSRALENLSMAIALKPSSAVAHCLAGTAYERSSSDAEAEQSFKHALELDNTMPAARLMLAHLYMRQKNWPASLENLEAYLTDHPFASDRQLVLSLISEITRKQIFEE